MSIDLEDEVVEALTEVRGEEGRDFGWRFGVEGGNGAECWRGWRAGAVAMPEEEEMAMAEAVGVFGNEGLFT
jgi:hypothetical protein